MLLVWSNGALKCDLPQIADGIYLNNYTRRQQMTIDVETSDEVEYNDSECITCDIDILQYGEFSSRARTKR